MFNKIDHIGIAVHNLEKTLEVYKRAYGLLPVKIETLDEIKVRIAFIPLGEVLIELLQPTKTGEGRIGQFLKEKGEGFHHIALRVKDIDNALEKFKNMNVPMRDETPRDGGDESRIAFIDPLFTQNVLTELVERKREITES